ncbi:MAG: matrixin family metalloprotease [Pseudomonadota bacterium]
MSMETAAPATAGTEYTYSLNLDRTQFTGDFSIADFEEVVRLAFQLWSVVADIDFIEVSDNRDVRTHIDVATTSDPVSSADSTWGRPGGILGFGGVNSQRFAWMDDAETWAPFGEGRDSNYFLVAAHEIGHAIGIFDHIEGGLQLMNARIGSQEGIYQGDIDAVIRLYGAREWSNDAETIDLSFVKAAQTVQARGGNDTIIATTLADTLHGGAGNDTINGDDGNDRIYDSLGSNTVSGGNNNDVIIGGAGRTEASGDNGSDIIIGGKGDDRLDGGRGNDSIRGDANSSFFHGDDVITAGPGTDYLEGGGGADTFVFRPNEGTNTIAELRITANNPGNTSTVGTDFEPGVDMIDVRAFGYSSRAEAFGNVSDVNGNARFADQGTVIVFQGLGLIDLSESDFIV